MRTSKDARRARRGREDDDTAALELVAEVTRAVLRSERAREAAPRATVPAVPRATRSPWSRRRRPAGATPTGQLIRSLTRGERTRQQ